MLVGSNHVAATDFDFLKNSRWDWKSGFLFFSRTYDIDDEMHFTDIEMAVFSVKNESDTNKDQSSSAIENRLQTACPRDSEWRFI